jgi:hypothetical protein
VVHFNILQVNDHYLLKLVRNICLYRTLSTYLYILPEEELVVCTKYLYHECDAVITFKDPIEPYSGRFCYS